MTGFLVTSRSMNTVVFGWVIRKKETFSLVNHGKTEEIWWWWWREMNRNVVWW